MSIVYIDTETTGLDHTKHEVWEIAYAIDDGPIAWCRVSHHGLTADDDALTIGNYSERRGFDVDRGLASEFEQDLIDILDGRTFCAANPTFDISFLRARWGIAPWKYRLFDIEAYAMGALGYEIPQGLMTIAADLTDKGCDIPTPDHTAAGDVATLRACHLALKKEYAR